MTKFVKIRFYHTANKNNEDPWKWAWWRKLSSVTALYTLYADVQIGKDTISLQAKKKFFFNLEDHFYFGSIAHFDNNGFFAILFKSI